MNTVLEHEMQEGGAKAMTLQAVFTIRNVQAFNFDHAKETARRFAQPYLLGRALTATAKREKDGTFTVEFR